MLIKLTSSETTPIKKNKLRLFLRSTIKLCYT